MSNGKGDKDRVTDLKRFKANYDEIKWRPRKHPNPWINILIQSEYDRDFKPHRKR